MVRYSLRQLLILITCAAVLTASVAWLYREYRGQLVCDRNELSFDRGYRDVGKTFDMIQFRGDVLNYLDKHVPDHGFVANDLCACERHFTTTGELFFTIYCSHYYGRRLGFPQWRIVADHTDPRAERLNAAMRDAMDYALERQADAMLRSIPEALPEQERIPEAEHEAQRGNVP